MPEFAPVSPETLRRERLQALGLDLLTLRESLAADSETPGVSDTASHSGRSTSGAKARLVLMLESGRQALAGKHAGRLRSLIAALGLCEDDVAFEPGSAPCVLAFGQPPPTTVTNLCQLPTLEQLADAQAKRAAWPRLRELRRRLQNDDG
jgi:hypothetical protein